MSNPDLKLSRKEREEAFRRDIILDAAETLFAEKGFAGTTVSDIAELSELAKGSLYQIFESKQEIIVAIVERKINTIHDGIEKIHACSINPLEKIDALIETKLRFVWESRKFGRIFIQELHGFWHMQMPEMKPFKAKMLQLLGSTMDVIIEGQKLGEFRKDISPPMILASFIGITNAVIHIWLEGNIEIDIETAIKQSRDLFHRGADPQLEGK